MRKNISLMLIFVALLSMTGCAAFKRKFVPSPKYKGKAAPVMSYVPTAEYKKTISNTKTYKKYYIYWKTMEGQLIDELGENTIRDQNSYENALYNLTAFQKYLIEEKAKELEVYVQQFKDICEKYLASGESPNVALRTKMFLDMHKRDIERRFSYKKVKDCILPD